MKKSLKRKDRVWSWRSRERGDDGDLRSEGKTEKGRKNNQSFRDPWNKRLSRRITGPKTRGGREIVDIVSEEIMTTKRREPFVLIPWGQHHLDTQNHRHQRKPQTDSSYGYRCKNPQQILANQMQQLRENYTPGQRGIYPQNTRLVQHRDSTV